MEAIIYQWQLLTAVAYAVRLLHVAHGTIQSVEGLKLSNKTYFNSSKVLFSADTSKEDQWPNSNECSIQSVRCRGSDESVEVCRQRVVATVTVGRRWRIKMRSLTRGRAAAVHACRGSWISELSPGWSPPTRRKTSNFPTDLLNLCVWVCVWLMILHYDV